MEPQYDIRLHSPPPIHPPDWGPAFHRYSIFTVEGYKRPFICGSVGTDGRVTYLRDSCGRLIRYAHARTARIALDKWKKELCK